MRARVSMLGNVSCLVTALLVAACGGDKSGSRTDSTGGTSSSSGGSGGVSTGTGGASAGGAGGLQAFPCEPKATLLSDFTASIDSSGKWGTSATLSGGSFTYGDADGDGKKDLTDTYATGAVNLKGHVATYTGYGMWFAPAMGQTYPCTDASKYSGLSFEVVINGGTAPSINVQVQHHDDSPVDTTNSRGGCIYSDPANMYSDCVYPNTPVVVPTDGSAIQVPWSMFSGGKPVATAEGGMKLDGLQWEFWKSDATPYDLDITLKNIKFY